MKGEAATAPALLGPYGRARPRAMLSLAPLIDVTFLLLIFFMLVTQFDRLGAIDVTVAQSPPVEVAPDGGTGAASDPALRLQVRSDGSLGLGEDELASPAALPGALAGAFAAVDRGAGTGPPLLLVDVQAEVVLQRLIDVLAVLQEQPHFDVRLVHEKAGEATSP